MNQLDQQLEINRDHINALWLEASRSRELQSFGSKLSLRRRLARALRNWAANLESDTTKTATNA